MEILVFAFSSSSSSFHSVYYIHGGYVGEFENKTDMFTWAHDWISNGLKLHEFTDGNGIKTTKFYAQHKTLEDFLLLWFVPTIDISCYIRQNRDRASTTQISKSNLAFSLSWYYQKCIAELKDPLKYMDVVITQINGCYLSIYIVAIIDFKYILNIAIRIFRNSKLNANIFNI